MTSVDDKKFLVEVIEVYRSLPALWDHRSKDYSNRTKKNEQYDELLQKYNEKYPEADRKALVKKINSLRTNFRKDLRRIRNSERSGAGSDEVLESTYFEHMKFLIDLEEPTESVSTMLGDEEEEENDSNTSVQEVARSKPKPSKKPRYDANEELLAKARKRLETPPDDYEKIAMAWAVELKKMDPQQQLFAKKGINDILFEGQMGTLTRNSVQVNVHNISRTSTPFSASVASPLCYDQPSTHHLQPIQHSTVQYYPDQQSSQSNQSASTYISNFQSTL